MDAAAKNTHNHEGLSKPVLKLLASIFMRQRQSYEAV